MGMVVQLHAKITLGRSFGCVPAHRGLKLSGPYRFVRHPMYAGYLLSHLAFLAMNLTPWNIAVYALCYSLQLPRLLAEERLLSRDRCYRDYRAAVQCAPDSRIILTFSGVDGNSRKSRGYDGPTKFPDG